MRSFVLVCFLLFHLTKVANAQKNLNAAVERLVNDPSVKYAGMGVCVLDLESGEVLGGNSMNESLTPASSLKVVTTASALGILGSDFRFKTELQYDGEIGNDGTLKGNLFIKGSFCESRKIRSSHC